MVWNKHGPDPGIWDRAERFLKVPKQVFKTRKMASESGNETLNLVLLVNKKYPESKHICSMLNSPWFSIIRKLNLLILDQGKILAHLFLCKIRGPVTVSGRTEPSIYCHFNNFVLYGTPLTQKFPHFAASMVSRPHFVGRGETWQLFPMQY